MACGCAQRPQVVVGGPGLPEVQHSFRRPFVLIGRSEKCDLKLGHSDVSSRHGYLQLIDGRLAGVDLSGGRGIRWATGKKTCAWIEPNEAIRIGPYEIRPGFEVPTTREPLPSPEQSRRDLPKTSVELLNCKNRPHVPIRRNITLVGSSKKCQIRLLSESVSDVHCSLVLSHTGLWVVDLLARDGIRVNGRVTRYAHLKDGDELTVGRRARIRVHYTPPVPGVQVTPESIAAADADVHSSSELSVITPEPIVTEPPAPVVTLSTREVSGGVSDHLVEKLINQFASMQQQMFEQTSQFMTLMTQSITAMHQEQMGLIRTELARVHEINDEMRGLQQRLLLKEAESSAVESPVAESHPAGQPATDVTGESPVADSRQAHKAAPPVEPDRAMDEAAPEQLQTPPKREPAAASADVSSPPATDAPDDYAWLSGRLEKLDKERRTRWQKIMKALSGIPGL